MTVKYSRLYTLCLLIALVWLASACGGLAGEPEIVATLPPQPTTAADVGYPVQPPDLARGARVFAANCTECHGADGGGNGALVQSGEVPRMAAFTDTAAAQDETPLEWFEVITNGRLENLMPPWKDALNEADRWAAALYTYGLHYTPEQIEQGKALWDDTARAINREAVDFSDQAAMVALSDLALADLMLGGESSFTEDERRAVVAYARSLTVTNAGVIGQTAPEGTADVSGVPGTVSGRVVNGTSASSVPAEIQVNLVVTNQGALVTQEQVTASADGAFSFENVPIIEGASYVTAVVYRDHLFTSDFIVGDPAVTAMDMTITVYELTEDPGVLSISGVVAQVSAVGDTLEVRQVFRFSNSSDRLFTTTIAVGENQFASVLVSLPPGSQIVSFDDPNRYVPSQQDFSFLDTAPVFPGDDHLVVVVYILPYDGSPALIEQPVNYPLNGQVRLLVAPQTLGVSSDQLPSVGLETVGQQTYAGYGTTLQLAPGDVIRYEVSGASMPASDGSGTPDAGAGNNVLPLLLGIIGAGAILAGVILFLRNRQTTPDKEQLIDALVRQIAELDDAHNAGELNHDVWHRQRAALKARLAQLIGEEKGESGG